MSTTEDVAQLWENVRDVRNPLRWVVSAVNEKNNGLVLLASGTTGFSAFVDALRDASGIIHAGIKVTGVDERGSVKSIRSQYVKVSMMTDDVPQLKRAKALQLKDSIDRAFSGANVVVDISSVEEINKSDLERRLASAAGAHKPGRYDFEGVEDDLQSASPTSPSRAEGSPKAVADSSPRASSPAAASTASEAPTSEKKNVDVQEGDCTVVAGNGTDGSDAEGKVETPNETKAAAAESAPESVAAHQSATATTALPAKAPETPVDEGPITIEGAWSRVHDDKHPNNFLVVSFDGKDPKTAEIVAFGSGDLSTFKSHLADDKPIYAGFRLRAIDDRGSVVSVRPKIIFVSMIGKNVRPVIRAQAGAVKPYFDSIFTGHHVPVFIADVSELTEDDIVLRLRQSGGAHQPNRYDFSGKKGQDV